MARISRWAGYGLGALVVIALVAFAAVWLTSSAKLHASLKAKPEHLAQPRPEQLADAERVARTLGCFSCHGEGLRGNKIFDEKNIATVWAPNLTRVAAHASDQQLAAAIRQGISDEGEPLVIMPSEAFQRLTDQQVAGLIAMIRKLPAGGTDTPANSYGAIGRLGLVMGRFNTSPQLVAKFAATEPVNLGPQVEAGRQLAMTRCSSCHGPALGGLEAKPGEMAPDLMIAGAYDLPAFTRLLRTGVPAGGQKLNMMGPTARSDLRHLTDAEIGQLHAYLQARAQRLSR